MFDYKHIDNDGQNIDLPLGKVVCVGRNYLQHIKELENDIPSEPLLFIKPSTSLAILHRSVVLPKNLGPCHNELEIAVLIKSPLSQASLQVAAQAIWGIGLGLDLTLREVQGRLKKQGQPWERAKAFDLSCPMSQFVAKEKVKDLCNITFSLQVNNSLRQHGNSQAMLFPILELLANISQTFSLLPGDIVMTGTPKGVAALSSDDQLEVELDGHFRVNTTVV
ncbi:fumarylacetoacetate hydrolase family protein [uncultured Paraglaciecola sp.]|uniref:fumarylacetoacetate hydrolase family protein n=1 Tax=uncultured Paraglaciecola sp. TaxID=1765024 RepID=UPI0026033BB7|nr:fumarylacetoacetate hydrolase family protein [uncultured Paraglaciecola sp.]